MDNNSEVVAFAQKLINREFGEFFIYPMHDQTIDAIWADEANHVLVEEVLKDPSIAVEAKFLAFEVLFKRDIFLMKRHSPEKVAEIYAEALVNNYTGMTNPWGLLYEENDDGTTGITLIAMGKKSIPALSKLLDDDSLVVDYHGSEEATIGNGYKYRIKDFAAYYIGRILGSPLKYYPTNEERDKQIEALKQKLETLEEE